jgi:hypothetical protein
VFIRTEWVIPAEQSNFDFLIIHRRHIQYSATGRDGRGKCLVLDIAQLLLCSTPAADTLAFSMAAIGDG